MLPEDDRITHSLRLEAWLHPGNSNLMKPYLNRLGSGRVRFIFTSPSALTIAAIATSPSLVGHDNLMDVYLEALAREMDELVEPDQVAVDTVFVGGGTPSHLPLAKQLEEAS